MTFADLLIHTCDIGKLSQDAKDTYGTPAKTWPLVPDGYTSQPCRLVSTTGREVKVGAEVVISDWKLFLDVAVLIDEQDRISNIIETSSGAVIDSSTFEILLVQPRSDSSGGHHLELALRKVV